MSANSIAFKTRFVFKYLVEIVPKSITITVLFFFAISANSNKPFDNLSIKKISHLSIDLLKSFKKYDFLN